MAAYSNPTDLVQNGTLALPIHRRAKAVTVQTGPDNHAAAAVQLRGSMDNENWAVIALHSPAEVDQTVFVLTLTGANQHGVAPSGALAYKYLQVIRTDANGGVCKVYVGVADSEG